MKLIKLILLFTLLMALALAEGEEGGEGEVDTGDAEPVVSAYRDCNSNPALCNPDYGTCNTNGHCICKAF